MRNIPSGEGAKDNENLGRLNKTTYSHTEEQTQKINTSCSASNTFNSNVSFVSENNGKKSGYLSPGLPNDRITSKFVKKNKRKTFASAK